MYDGIFLEMIAGFVWIIAGLENRAPVYALPKCYWGGNYNLIYQFQFRIDGMPNNQFTANTAQPHYVLYVVRFLRTHFEN